MGITTQEKKVNCHPTWHKNQQFERPQKPRKYMKIVHRHRKAWSCNQHYVEPMRGLRASYFKRHRKRFWEHFAAKDTRGLFGNANHHHNKNKSYYWLSWCWPIVCEMTNEPVILLIYRACSSVVGGGCWNKVVYGHTWYVGTLCGPPCRRIFFLSRSLNL